MPKLEFTPQELKAYFSDDANARHCFYQKSVDEAKEMSVHADGSYPCELLDERRPNEPTEVQEYRKKIFPGCLNPILLPNVMEWVLGFQSRALLLKPTGAGYG